MIDARVKKILLGIYFNLYLHNCPNIEEFEYLSRVSYFSIIGSIILILVCFRYDLAYDVSVLSKYISNPSKHH